MRIKDNNELALWAEALAEERAVLRQARRAGALQGIFLGLAVGLALLGMLAVI